MPLVRGSAQAGGESRREGELSGLGAGIDALSLRA